MFKIILPFLLAFGCFQATEGAKFDLVLRGGRVVDGTGSPARFADVAVREGKIVAVGSIGLEAGDREIDARGLVVAPGFIDVHTHADEVAEQPEAQNFVRMGVTTIVVGNCGGSAVDLKKFWTEIAATNVAVNVATLVGHNSVRQRAMGGSFNREPTEEELAEMKELVRQAMEEGALGLSTGLIYLPGTFSRTEEIIELAKVASEYGGIYVSHMRDEGREIWSALEELFRIAREAKIPAHISHIKLSGKSAWGQAEKVLALVEAQRRSGLDLTQDQYAYTASSTGISQLVPEEAREGGKFAERMADPQEKARVTEEMKRRLKLRGQEDFAYAVIAHYRKDSSLNGLNIKEAARKLHGSETLDDQIEVIIEIVKEGGASGVFHGMNEEDLRTFMRHPNTMFACDSGLRKFGEGVPHPRGYGNNARVLGRYVREEKVLRMEEAVRRMTTLPAQVFGIKGRGQVAEGYSADLVIFDEDKVLDAATYNQPHRWPEGVDYVLVNGNVVLEKGNFTGGGGKGIKRKADRNPR